VPEFVQGSDEWIIAAEACEQASKEIATGSSCNPLKVNPCFGWKFRLHLQCSRIYQEIGVKQVTSTLLKCVVNSSIASLYIALLKFRRYIREDITLPYWRWSCCGASFGSGCQYEFLSAVILSTLTCFCSKIKFNIPLAEGLHSHLIAMFWPAAQYWHVFPCACADTTQTTHIQFKFRERQEVIAFNYPAFVSNATTNSIYLFNEY
jgi:hypothetical protein